MKIKIVFLFFTLFLVGHTQGQVDSADSWPDYKNTIKWNLTPTLVLGSGSWVFGYERMVKENQSFSVNAGFIQIPSILSNHLDSLQIDRNVKRRGVSFAADYRFYMTGRNKNKAPDGIYWGPYLASYFFDTEMNVKLIDNNLVQSDFDVESQIWTTMLGVEIGYQFVLGQKRRWIVDLILVGPSIRYDNINLKTKAIIQGNPDNEVIKEIQALLSSLIPGFEQLSSTGELNAKGFTSGFGAGYRYVVQVGYRF